MDKDEKKLFHQAMQGVKPLAASKTIKLVRQTKNIIKQPEIATDELDLEQVSDSYHTDVDEQMEFSRAGIQHKVMQRLKRGEPRPRAMLDLHGFTIDMARHEVVKFIHLALADGLKSVIIIHGKGNRSEGKFAVLKPKVNIWLRQLDSVLAFCEAQPHDGGGGAVYVLLRSKRSELEI